MSAIIETDLAPEDIDVTVTITQPSESSTSSSNLDGNIQGNPEDEIMTPGAIQREQQERIDQLREALEKLSVEQRQEFFEAISNDSQVDLSVKQEATTTLSRLLASIPEDQLIQNEYTFPKELTYELDSLEVLSDRVPEWRKLQGMKLKDVVMTMHTLSFDDTLITLFYHILKSNFIHCEVLMEHVNILASYDRKLYIPYDKFLCECAKGISLLPDPKKISTLKKSFLYCLYYYWFGTSSFPMRDVVVNSSDLHGDVISLISGTIHPGRYADMDNYTATTGADLWITHNFANTAAYGVNIQTDSDAKILENPDNYKMVGALVSKMSLGKTVHRLIEESAVSVDDSD